MQKLFSHCVPSNKERVQVFTQQSCLFDYSTQGNQFILFLNKIFGD